MAPPAAAGVGSVRRGTGRQALAVITEPARIGDGWRCGFIGDTGMGKTWAMRELVSLPGQLVLIHDEKQARPEYPAARYFPSIDAALNVPIEGADADIEALAFRGDVYAGQSVPVDDVAGLALRCARIRMPVRLVVDELDRAITRGGRELDSEALRLCFTQGRCMGLSVVWGTQTPQRVPREVLDQSSAVGIFRVGPRALGYLDERCFFDPDMLATVERLQVGEFVLWCNGHRWDRTVYKF